MTAAGPPSDPEIASFRPSSPRRARVRAVGLLAICAGVLAAGSLVEVTPERAHLHGVEAPKCLVGGWFGDSACPGCGLTRGTALVLQGRWESAWTVHAGGFAIALLCLAGIPIQIDVLRRGRIGPRQRLLARWGRGILLLGVLGPWLARAVATPW